MGDQQHRDIVFHRQLLELADKGRLRLIQVVRHARVHRGHQVVDEHQLDAVPAHRLPYCVEQAFPLVVHRVVVVQKRPAAVPAVDPLDHRPREEIALVAGKIDVHRDMLRPRRLKIHPPLEVVVGQFPGIRQHAVPLVERLDQQLRRKGGFALAPPPGQQHHLPEKQPADDVVQLRQAGADARQGVKVNRLHVRQLPDVGYRRRFCVFDRFAYRRRPVFAQDVVGVLLAEIVRLLHREHLVRQPLLQRVEQRDLAALAVPEHHHLVKLHDPLPHVFEKGEPVAAVGHAHRVVDAGLGRRQRIELPFGDHQPPEIHALRHAEKDGLGVPLAPFLAFVPAAVEIGFAVFEEL